MNGNMNTLQMAAPMKLKLTDLQTISKENLNFLREQTYSYKNFEEVGKINYYAFFEDFLLPNKPCIFSPEVTKYWKSRQEWVLNVLENRLPNFELLRSKFGDASVPVANCKQEQYSSHPKQEMLLSEFLDYWEKYRNDGYPADKPCLYLKDWHFTKAYPDYQAYSTPVYFQSDWLNEFWDTLPRDDYRFVYMGPKGTWTPFHADVYRSYSWSANICGKKKWIFYPPGCEEKLKDGLGNLVYDVTSPELDNQKKFPNAHKVKGEMLEVIQGEGQIIFVPSGWHHQVFNLEDTISINHNWLNGCNIDICWKHLQDGLHDVKREIENCRDMDGWNMQCQLILKACAGIDYMEFIKMLRVIAENRIEQYRQFQQRCSRYARLETENCSGIAQLDVDNIGPGLENKSVISSSVPHCEVEASELQETQENENDMEDGKICKTCETRELTEQQTCKCPTTCSYGREATCDKCLEILNFGSDSRWTYKEYLTFDLNRIREILQDIILDEDYRCIERDDSNSAEYIVKMVETWKEDNK